MSQYYNPNRTRNIFNPGSSLPFKISRSKIDLFVECARCFYLDRRLGVGRPPGFPFTLNSAVDTLLKKEFDIFREKGETHPLIKKYGVDAVPVSHKELDVWRNNFKGIQYLYEPVNIIVTGVIDDLWQNSKGKYIIVDYKATSKNKEITALDEGWHDGYKRQMEVYQWLLRRKGYNVSNTGYFLYCNGKVDRETFQGKLEFDLTLIPYEGSEDWIEDTIKDIHTCLMSDEIPPPDDDCDFCAYRNAVRDKLKSE